MAVCYDNNVSVVTAPHICAWRVFFAYLCSLKLFSLIYTPCRQTLAYRQKRGMYYTHKKYKSICLLNLVLRGCLEGLYAMNACSADQMRWLKTNTALAISRDRRKPRARRPELNMQILNSCLVRSRDSYWLFRESGYENYRTFRALSWTLETV